MTLYNCRIDGDQYRITKFDADFNVESSYLCTETECECPAGHRDICRHRTMLPRFIRKSATKANWFHNFEQNQWHRAENEDEIILEDEDDDLGSAATLAEAPTEPAFEESLRASASTHGFTMLDLANPSTIYNTIAEAVGEPLLKPHSTTVSTPDFDSGNGGSNPPVVATRQTFTIPPGHEAIHDANGRATGKIQPIPKPLRRI